MVRPLLPSGCHPMAPRAWTSRCCKHGFVFWANCLNLDRCLDPNDEDEDDDEDEDEDEAHDAITRVSNLMSIGRQRKLGEGEQ